MNKNTMILEDRIQRMVEDDVMYGKAKYAKYLESARKAVPTMSQYMESNLVKSLRAFESEASRVFGPRQLKAYYETSATTTPTEIDSFIHHGFDMVSIMSVGNPIEEFMTTQSMEKRVGEIFYMDIEIAKTKGSYTAGDDYLSSDTGPETGETYSSEEVDIEDLGTGDGSTIEFTATLQWLPIKPYTITNSEPEREHTGCTINYTVNGTAYEVTDTNGGSGTGTFVDSVNLNAGTINYSTGVVTLTFKGTRPPDNGTSIYANYWWDSARDDITQQPTLLFNLRSKYVTAQRRFLNTKWMVDSAIMLQKEHGSDIEKDFVEKVLSGVMNEIAVQAANKLYTGATANSGSVTQFNRKPPNTTVPYIVNRQEVLGTIQAMGTDIEDATRKVTANFVIGGKDICNVLKGLPRDMYEPVQYADKTPVGMHTIGVLDNQYKVVQNLDYTANKFLVGAKGPDWLTTGAIYSPFIPLMTTPVNWAESGNHWRSLLTWYAITIVNGLFYNKGQVIYS